MEFSGVKNETVLGVRVGHLGETSKRHAVIVLIGLLSTTLTVLAGERDTPYGKSEIHEPGDLTFSNLFSAGWNEPWMKRSRGDGTPDLSLLRAQTNFLVKASRSDFAHQDNLSSASIRAADALTTTFEYTLNRRLMFALLGSYSWMDSRLLADKEGATGGGFIRLQWVDTVCSSLSSTLKVVAPNHDLGEKDTALSFSVAGWFDLAPLGLKRTGLYYHVQEETLAGPYKPDARRNALSYALSFAKTWSNPDSFFGNASTFIEAYGKTDLDGNDSGFTYITLTPGIRATFAHRHTFMAGVEFPISTPRPFEQVVRISYICSF